jgi:hypothetical protein
MAFSIGPSDIKKLEKVFGVPARTIGDNIRFELAATEEHRKLALEIYADIPIGHRKGTLVSVYTENAHLQLHFCSGYVVSELLGEVTFVAEQDGKVSGLIIERQGGCSLFANVDRSLVSGDFTQLGPEVMLSGIALSLTDGILDAGAEGAPSKPAPRRTAVKRSGGKKAAAKKRGPVRARSKSSRA